jgi:SAM-dependent methyltransferase
MVSFIKDAVFKVTRRVWRALPPFIKSSSIADILKRHTLLLVGKRNQAPKQITTLEELDRELKMLDAAAAISDNEVRKGFETFAMKFPYKVVTDPNSDEYRAQQFKLYEWLHGRPYSNTHEVSEFDVDKAADVPFPFYTKSPNTVGNQLIAIGNLIRTMNLQPKAKILEFGPGWGNTTIWLAKMGYAVTAVDIEANFINLIRKRASRSHLKINAIEGDFSLIKKIEGKFDAILFFECFHHCSNHQDLVASFQRAISPGGKIIFGAEPIDDGFHLPWGLRLDGESLLAIRKFGWLELGFQERYFRSLLSKYGWVVEKHNCTETPWGVIFIATRNKE